MIKFKRISRMLLTVFACVGFSVAVSSLGGVLAQRVSPEYLQALVTIYTGGATANLVKEWCDERAPQTKARNALVFEAWRKRMDLPKVDAALETLAGDTSSVSASIEEQRAPLYAQLDSSSSDPGGDCATLEASLNADFNLKLVYAAEYKVFAAGVNAKSSPSQAGSGQSSSGQSSSGQSSSGQAGSDSGASVDAGRTSGHVPLTAKLPSLPPFDYRTFVKLNIDPNKQPIPDEYHCWANFSTDAYQKPHMIVQILPGGKYRAAFGSSIGEGKFSLERRKITFLTGPFIGKEEHTFSFSRTDGTNLFLIDPLDEPNPEKRRYYWCDQREAAVLRILKYKRNDPQPGKYACTLQDGKGTDRGTLEILPSRRYRYVFREKNEVGAYRADILSESSFARIYFDGSLKGNFASYSSGRSGRQEFSFNPSDDPVDCIRSGPAMPDPKYGKAKAPSAPSKGGFEGRYYVGYAQVAIGDFPAACGGTCYNFYFFQKDGYVFTGDATATEGLMDIDCGKTHLSGFPVCETYSINKNMIKIGLEKPVSFQKLKDGIKIDGGFHAILESVDGIKLNAEYETVSSAGGGFNSTYSYVAWGNLKFNSNGTFVQERSTSVSTVVSAANSYSPDSGTYRLYGNTLELRFRDGTVVRRFIMLTTGRKNLTYLNIGGTQYWIKGS
jgi:hypothetical protein